MKHLRSIISIIAILTLASCTHNNGDIGNWFGSWKVEQIQDEDGQAVTYEGTLYFQFQSKVFNMRLITDHHTYTDCFGNWKEEDKSLLLTFPDDMFVPFPFTGLGKTNHVTILERTSSKMVLTYPDTDSRQMKIILIKWV